MDSDDQLEIKNKTGKKTKGRKKSTATNTTKTTKSTKKSTKGRRIKNVLESDSEDEQIETKSVKKAKLSVDELTTKDQFNISSLNETSDNLFKKINVDHKLTELTSSTISTQLFTGTSRLNVPLLHDNKPLNWNHKINLIGEKSIEQRVHLCDICAEPILYYGRLIPCKHVFCYDCAIEIQEKLTLPGCCLNCNERIARIERVELNSMYICNHDKICKRTYLSQRDLLAHIQHRHTKKEKSNSSSEKSLKLKSHSFNSKDEFQTSSFVQKSTNHHHYPQPSLHTLQWINQQKNTRHKR